MLVKNRMMRVDLGMSVTTTETRLLQQLEHEDLQRQQQRQIILTAAVTCQLLKHFLSIQFFSFFLETLCSSVVSFRWLGRQM